MKLLTCALLLPCLLLTAGTPDKSAKEAVIAPAEAWGYPLLGGGVKTSDVYIEGSFFLTLPLHSSIGLDGTLGGDYLFVEPYTSWGEQGEVASSLGFGWRHLFSGQPVSKLKDPAPAGLMDEGWYLGASLFVDRLDTQFDNVFWQMGVGAEIGSRYAELRGNYYIPFDGDRKLAFKDVQKQTFTSTSTQFVQSGGGAGAPFAQGNAIYQDTGGTITEVKTTSTTTITRTTSVFEEGMEGWDAELALLVPWVDQWGDVKVIGGYFAFDNQPFGPQTGSTGNVEGWKAGIEVRPVPAVVLNAMWYDDERFTGSDWTAGIRFEIPLGREWRDAFRPRRRHLVERMAEPVHRQNAAVKIGNSKEEEQQSSTTTAATRRVVSQGQGVITIAEDIIFVNNGPASGNGIQQAGATQTGTAEQPFDTVQEGADAAGTRSTTSSRVWTTYVQGGGADYVESVDVNTGSVNFVASGPYGGITAKNGQVFGATSPIPVIDGGIAADNFPFIGVHGFDMKNGHSGSGDILRMENIGELSITGNFLKDASDDAILVGGEGVESTVLIQGNLIQNVADDFLDVQFIAGSVVDMIVRQNDMSGAADFGVEFDSDNSGISFAFTGNLMKNVAVNGVSIHSNGSSLVDATISGNTVEDIGEVALELAAFSGGLEVTLIGNAITGVSTGISIGGLAGGSVTGLVSSNNITNATTPQPGGSGLPANWFGNGILLVTQDAGATMDLTLDNNTITGTLNHGFVFEHTAGTTMTLDGSGSNTVTGEANNKLDATGAPTGTIILNGVAVPVNVDVP